MTIGLFLRFHPGGPKWDTSFYGIMTLKYYEILDDLAVEIGVTPLSGFGDNRMVPEGFDGTPDELDALLGPSDAWFDASAALSSLQQLRANLDRREADIPAEDRSILAAEIDELLPSLAVAATRGVRIQFDVG